MLVEKILEHGELLPPFWATAGTTGYDALAELDRVLVDPAGRPRLDALDAGLRRDGGRPWTALIHDTKRAIADGILHSEVRRLGREVRAAGVTEPHQADADVDDAIAELLACFPVYRSYLPYGREHLDAALADAQQRRPELADTLSAVHGLLADPDQPAAIRFQQTSGMVMAKGVEDTAFYRVSRLASLTEVGADPAEFSVTVAEFHERQQSRLAAYPLSMTTLSTHDTKRGEDTRARISVISEAPEQWAAFLARRRARHPLGDGAFENVLWESIVGSWPRDRDALHAYAEKAAREAGTSTGWAAPDTGFEQKMHELVDAVFDDPAVTADVEAMVELLAPAGRSNGLGGQAAATHRAGRPRRLPGQRALGAVARRPRQPSAGRLRRSPAHFWPSWMPASARRRRDRCREAPGGVAGAAAPARPARAVHALRSPARGRRRGRPSRGRRPRRRRRPGDAALVRAGRGRRMEEHGRAAAGRPVARRADGPRVEGGETPVAELLADYPVALLRTEEGTP